MQTRLNTTPLLLWLLTQREHQEEVSPSSEEWIITGDLDQHDRGDGVSGLSDVSGRLAARDLRRKEELDDIYLYHTIIKNQLFLLEF